MLWGRFHMTLGRWTGPGTPKTSILGGPEPRFLFGFSIVFPFEFTFDFLMNFRCSLQPMSSRSWMAKRRQTLILCALARFLKVFLTSRIPADAMKASSSDRGSSKSRSTKSIEFSSKNRTEVVEILGLRPNLAKNASERVMGVLPDVSGAPPSEPAAPQERSGRAPGAR